LRVTGCGRCVTESGLWRRIVLHGDRLPALQEHTVVLYQVTMISLLILFLFTVNYSFILFINFVLIYCKLSIAETLRRVADWRLAD